MLARLRCWLTYHLRYKHEWRLMSREQQCSEMQQAVASLRKRLCSIPADHEVIEALEILDRVEEEFRWV